MSIIDDILIILVLILGFLGHIIVTIIKYLVFLCIIIPLGLVIIIAFVLENLWQKRKASTIIKSRGGNSHE